MSYRYCVAPFVYSVPYFTSKIKPNNMSNLSEKRQSLQAADAATGGCEARLGTDAALSDRQAILDKLTKEREHVLDRWADADTLGLSQIEKEINSFQREHLKFMFGEKGVNPPINARNPVSVTMHNPRFSAALWAVNTEAYRRKGTVGSLFFFLALFRKEND